MNFSELVEQNKVVLRKHNITVVQEQINEPWVQTKIENYLNRFPGLISKKEIEDLIKTNEVFASFFCKDPSKQNVSEKMAEELLKTKKLPASGKNSIRFDSNGNITSQALGNTKSADFYIDGMYITQKYTIENGGAQDNQKNDVIDFLRRGSIQHKVMALLDGPYWDIHRKDLIKIFLDNPNVIIHSMDSFLEDRNVRHS